MIKKDQLLELSKKYDKELRSMKALRAYVETSMLDAAKNGDYQANISVLEFPREYSARVLCELLEDGYAAFHDSGESFLQVNWE